VRARQQPASIVIGRISSARAAVRALLVDGDALADDLLLELSKRELRLLAVLGVGLGSGSPEYCSSTASSTALVASWRSSLSSTCVASSSCAPCEPDLREQVRVDLRRLDDELRLAGLLGQLALAAHELLDRVVGDVERVEDLGLGDLVGARPRPSGSRPRCRPRRGRGRSPPGATPQAG
jgi:hypothetical protein